MAKDHDNVVEGKWEQRWHPLRQEWVVYSAHRNSRPWHGAEVEAQGQCLAHDPDCYLCPGNTRISGIQNPDYEKIYVFDNDHPVVGPRAPDLEEASDTLYKKRSASGLARVICYDPRHHVSLADLKKDQVGHVLQAWREQVIELSQRPEVNFILFFENRGEITGVSSMHPHCQLYATNFVFKNVETELRALKKNTSIFSGILALEQQNQIRIVAENDHAIAFVPFFARYPYEVWLFPKKPHADLSTLSDQECHDVGSLYQEIVRRYDLLYDRPFPYVMSLYQAPCDGQPYEGYHLHFVFLPPLRQPGVQKFPAGPEIGGGNFMNDTLPEETAATLRAMTIEDYRSKK